MSRSIKSYVEQGTREGLSAEEIYRAAESALPGRHISWNYIVGIRRRYLRERAAQRATPTAPLAVTGGHS